MKVLLRSFSYFISILCLLLSGCDTVSDAVTSEPSKSVCTAYCEWAAACNSTARESDEMALFESCLATTQAQDPDCQVMESEGLNKVSHAINQSCVESIEEEQFPLFDIPNLIFGMGFRNELSAFSENLLEYFF